MLICVDFGDIGPSFSPHLTISLRSHIKNLKQCFIRHPNTLQWVKKNLAALCSLTHFAVFRYLMKHCSLCLIYYFRCLTQFLGYAAVIIGKTSFDSSGCLSILPCIDKCIVRNTCCVTYYYVMVISNQKHCN